MRAHDRSRVVALVWSGLLAAVLGCGGDGDGPPRPSATPTAGPTATPAATATPSGGVVVAHGAVPALPAGIASGAGRFLVAWSSIVGRAQPDVFGVRTDANGNVADASPLQLSDLGTAPFLDAACRLLPAPGGLYVVDRGEITHLTGRVLDPRGNPVRNALVEIWPPKHNGSAPCES